MLFIRSFLTLAAVAAVSSCAAPAAEQPAGLEGRTIRSGCRQGECSWLRIVRIETAESRSEGELRRIVARSGRSVHGNGGIPRRASDARIGWEPSDGSSFAFCSTRRPAFAFPDDDGGLIVHFLDPFALAGYQESSALLYMAVCHGSPALPREAALRALGYRPGTRSEQIEGADLEAMTRF